MRKKYIEEDLEVNEAKTINKLIESNLLFAKLNEEAFTDYRYNGLSYDEVLEKYKV